MCCRKNHCHWRVMSAEYIKVSTRNAVQWRSACPVHNRPVFGYFRLDSGSITDLYSFKKVLCFQFYISQWVQVDSFVNHCDANYLELNVSKTKEMVIDFRQTRPDPQPVDIKGSAVARVDTYKYLGIVLNNKLSWGDHVDFIVKKLNSRMYCLRKLNSFHITPEILNVFYSSTIVSVWRYYLVCWGGNVRNVASIVSSGKQRG